ncbi:MAG TPA: peptidylprolyl isomerase [Thermoanaerobaculia bacterium]|jgi:parvulin-like peptidyl-prolyl isomerase
MFEKTRPPLLALGLALLLAGWVGCKAAPEKEEAPAPAAANAGKAAPATPGQPPAAPGSQTATSPTPPGGPAPGQPVSPGVDKPMSAKDLPEVVAKVNGYEIHKKDLMQAAQMVQMRLAQQGRPVSLTASFYRNVLDEVVAIVLLQQDAKAQGVAATEQEVQQQIEAQKRRFPSEDAYNKALAQSGLKESALRQQARDQIAVQKYVQGKLIQSLSVSDQATRDFYEKNKAQIQQPERLHLRHILIRVQPNASPADKEKARQKAADLLKRLQAGEDFAKLAQESSDDPGSKPRGGDLGWVARGQTVPIPTFENAAFALTKPNEISPVVESPYGFHIIQLLERQQPAIIPYEQVKNRLGMMLKEQQAQQQIASRVRELRGKAKVEIYI